ncbi:MAG: hypothetical protein ACLQBA_00745 [Candidatus Binataceae bacterium]
MEEIDAGARFLGEFAKTIPVLAAFWVRVSEEDSGYLYVTSDQLTESPRDPRAGDSDL